MIVVTAFGSERVCAEAFRRGARDYLPKPVDHGEMRRAVQVILRDSRLTDRAPPTTDVGTLDPSRVASVATRIEWVARFLEEHHAERLSLATMARLVNLGPFTLSHVFKAQLSMSLRDFLQSARISKGQQLLKEHRMSITEVAHVVGYSDLARFDKVFKKLTGMTPSEYRRARPQDSPAP